MLANDRIFIMYILKQENKPQKGLGVLKTSHGSFLSYVL